MNVAIKYFSTYNIPKSKGELRDCEDNEDGGSAWGCGGVGGRHGWGWR